MEENGWNFNLANDSQFPKETQNWYHKMNIFFWKILESALMMLKIRWKICWKQNWWTTLSSATDLCATEFIGAVGSIRAYRNSNVHVHQYIAPFTLAWKIYAMSKHSSISPLLLIYLAYCLALLWLYAKVLRSSYIQFTISWWMCQASKLFRALSPSFSFPM